MSELLPQHLEDLRRSGLSDETINLAGIHSEKDASNITRMLRWPRPAKKLGACLAIPYRNLDGNLTTYYRLKPDNPITEGGKKRKYEAPIGGGNRAYFPPRHLDALADPSTPLIITEGEKKALKADQEGFVCIGISGVWNWTLKRERDANGKPHGERELIKDLDAINWHKRLVHIIFDSDAATNANVRHAERELAEVLIGRGAYVRIHQLPSEGKEKVGLDDYLKAHGTDALRKLMDNQQAHNDDPWEPPIPLGADVFLPHFPVDCLPDWLGRYAVAESDATQTPLALPATVALGACAGGLAGRFRVMIRPGWQEPLNLFIVNSLPSGERKSQVVRDLLQPIQDLEKRLQEEATPRIAAAACDHRILEGKVKSLEGKAAKAKAAEVERFRTEAKEAARQLAAHHVPELPQLHCDDETPENLAKLLARQGERMFQASAEGTVFEICKGRYSESANFDVYLKGHAGDLLRTGRVIRGTDTVDRPALTVVLAVQPDVIAGLGSEVQMRGRGFLARWLYSIPPSKVGKRLVRARPVPREVELTYQANLLKLWQLDGSSESPHLLHFSEDADALLANFERWLEPQLAPEEELSLLAGWANKLAGAVARIAGILHVADAVGRAVAWDFPIDAATVEKAIDLGKEYFLPHALAAFAQMGADQKLEDARRIFRWLGNRFCESVNCVKGGAHLAVSQRDLHVEIFGGSRKVEEVEAAVDLMVKHLYLRPVEPPRSAGKPGRKPSCRFEVNPQAFPRCPPPFTQFTNSQNGQANPGDACEE
jgi:hypothetical protein